MTHSKMTRQEFIHLHPVDAISLELVADIRRVIAEAGRTPVARIYRHATVASDPSYGREEREETKMEDSRAQNGKNILVLFFSATGNTEKMARVMEGRFAELGCKVTMANMTPYVNRQEELDLTPYGAVVFGAPVHVRRAPRVMREWLRTLDGQGKKCSMFFTYGGFGVHPTHYSTRQILEEQGFRVVSSAEFLSVHTYNLGGWKAMEGRPDERDFAVAREYAERTFKRFINGDENLLGELEKTEYPDELLDAAESSRFEIVTQLPTRRGQDCGMCLKCEESCPNEAISAESGEADPERCIVCLACVANCPEQALEINDLSTSWPLKLKKENATEASLKELESKLYF